MTAIVARTPVWLRKAFVDFVSVLAVGALAITVSVPDGGSWRDWAVAAAAALLNVALNALRRAAVANMPDALAWLAQLLGTTPTAP